MSNIVVPQLGESVVEARVARWLKKEGDRVETGEPVVELETEKIDLEVGADHGGVITSIKRQDFFPPHDPNFSQSPAGGSIAGLFPLFVARAKEWFRVAEH